MEIVFLGLAGLLFVAAAVLMFRHVRQMPLREEWLLLALALLSLGAAAGLRAYLLAADLPAETLDLVAALLVLLGGGSACAAVYYSGRRSLADQRMLEKTQADLAQYRASFERDDRILAIKDRQGSYMAANPAYAQLLGKKDQDLAGKTDADFFPQAQAFAFRQEEEKALVTGAAQTRDVEIQAPGGPRWLRFTRSPFLDAAGGGAGTLLSGQDVTDLKRAEAALAAWRQGLAALSDAELALREAPDAAPSLETLLAWAGKLGGALHGGVWQVAPERSASQLKVGMGKLERLAGNPLAAKEPIVWKAWQSGQPVLANDYAAWPESGKWASPLPGGVGARPLPGGVGTWEAGFTAAIGLPLKVKAQSAYVLALFLDAPGAAFREEQARWLGLFAQIASSRLQNSDRLSASQGELDERQQAINRLQFRVRLEHLVAVIAAYFITLDPEKVDEGIHHSLQTLARFSGVERCHLVLLPGARSQGARYSSETPAVEEGSSAVGDEDARWYLSRLNQSEVVHIPRLAELGADAEEAASYLQARKIKSFTAIPMVSNRSVIGYLAFEALRAEVDWSPEILALLKVSAEMFVNLLERRWAAREAREIQEKVGRQITTLEQRSRESATITELGDLLQACRTPDEAYPIITRYIQRLIPQGSGALYMVQDTKDPAECVAVWGSDRPSPAEHELVLNECWGLRRGRVYAVQDPVNEPLCGHLKDPVRAGYLCAPLMAHGTAVGVLHLRVSSGQGEMKSFSEGQQALAVKVAEYTAMALTNLKLRDNLRSQAIRDPLTRLFNRRYMEETLEREIRRANRHVTSVGIIMFDIDKMKPINDRFGHDAGDLVLRGLGAELLRAFRGEDVACRYGGDEFTIVLPEASLADVWQRAEQMREAVKRLDLQYEGKRLGPLTLSIGVAAYPDHGANAEKVLLAADAASYAAKSEGGDRIMVGRKVEG